MKQAILLVTWAGTINLARDLLFSLADYDKPIVVVINEAEAVPTSKQETLDWLFANYTTIPVEGNRWEVGGLQAIFSFTDYDEWILIQDTLEVNDTSIFDQMFAFEGRSVAFGPGWLCYLGKYRRQILSNIMLPTCLNKMDAFYWEHMLHRVYDEVALAVEGEEPIVLFPDWGNSNPKNTTDYKFNRQNIVLFNEFVTKRKSAEWKLTNHMGASVKHL